MGRYIDLIDKKFGRLLVTEKTNERSSDGGVIWICRCECGKLKKVKTGELKDGHIKSCGCLGTENRIKAQSIHGMSHTRPNIIWKNMKARCGNINHKDYKNYGGRDIKVCERWEKFSNFWEDMKDGYADNLSIDRVNNDGNYEPGNCRWATSGQQANNTRSNHFLTFNGKTQTMTQWARELGVKQETIRNRIKEHWSIEKALTTPSRR